MVRNERGRGVGMNDRKKQKKMIHKLDEVRTYHTSKVMIL